MNQRSNAIMRLLGEQTRFLTNLDNEVPQDYKSLEQSLLLIELRQEIAALNEMLKNPSTFVEKFKARCLFRETDQENTFPFQVMPKSKTNELYWQIAILVFEPKNMKEMLAIILPSIQYTLTLDTEYSFVPGMETYREQLILKKINHLSQYEDCPPLLDHLTRVIVVNDLLFDLDEMKLLRLSRHIQLQQLLEKEYPQMAARLYAHNSSLDGLYQDMLKFNNKGLTPQVAIERLIRGLILGGEKITKQEFAGKLANEAIGRFFAYFDSLPPEIQEQLRVLRGENNISLGDIIDKEIIERLCVETAANHLNSVLKANSNQAVLVSSPAMSPSDLAKLKNQYGRGRAINIIKDEFLLTVFPGQLTRNAIARSAFNTDEDFVNFFLAFPSALYELLWQNITLHDPKQAYDKLALIIEEGFFNPDQRTTLAKAMTSQYHRFGFSKPLLFWAIRYGAEFFEDVIKFSCPDEDQRFSTITTCVHDDTLLLEYATYIPHVNMLKILISNIPPKDRLKALQITNDEGRTILHIAIRQYSGTPANIRGILSLILQNEVFSLISIPDDKGSTALHDAVYYPAVFEEILSFISEKELLVLMNIKNNRGKTLLQKALEEDTVLKMIFAHLDESNQLSVVTAKDEQGDTLLHHITSSAMELEVTLSLSVLLSIIPSEDRLKALTVQNKNLDTPLQRAAFNRFVFQAMLSSLPNKDRMTAMKLHEISFFSNTSEAWLNMVFGVLRASWFEAVQIGHTFHDTLLHCALQYPELLKKMLSLFSKDELHTVLNLENEYKQTVLNVSLCFPDSLKVILECFDYEDRVKIVTEKDKDGNTLLHHDARKKYYSKSLNVLLDVVPKKDRLTAVTAQNHQQETPLHLAAHASMENVKVIFRGDCSRMPEEDVMTALKAEDSTHKKFLFLKNDVEWFNLMCDYLLDYGYYEESDLVINGRKNSFWRPNVFEGLQITDENGRPFLHHLFPYPALLKRIFFRGLYAPPLRANEIQRLMKIEDNNGRRLMYELARYPESFNVLHDRYKIDAGFFDLMFDQDKNGNTLLHEVASYPAEEPLKTLLSTLAYEKNTEHRLRAVSIKNNHQETVLDIAARDSKRNFEVIQSLLSPEDRQKIELQKQLSLLEENLNNSLLDSDSKTKGRQIYETINAFNNTPRSIHELKELTEQATVCNNVLDALFKKDKAAFEKNIGILNACADKAQGKPSFGLRLLGSLMIGFGIAIAAVGSVMLAGNLGLCATGVLTIPGTLGLGVSSGMIGGGLIIAGVGVGFFYQGRRKELSATMNSFKQSLSLRG